MKLSLGLAKTLSVTKEYNEDAFNFINELLSYAPSIDNIVKYCSSPVISYETVGSLYGIDGSWKIILHLNDSRHIKDIFVAFSENGSTKSEYQDTYAVTINGFKKNNSLYHNLVTCEQKRVNNYRFASPSFSSLTTEEVKELSRAEILKRTTLSYSGHNTLIKQNSKTTNGRLETTQICYPYFYSQANEICVSLDKIKNESMVTI